MDSVSEARERGLVRQVVPADQVLRRAIDVARDLVTGTAPVSVALIRQMMWGMLGVGGPEVVHAAESAAIYSRGVSDDVREGVDAFLSKRVPIFPDLVSSGIPDVRNPTNS